MCITGDFQSGQMGQTVNLLSMTSVVRIHHLPPKKVAKRGNFLICIYKLDTKTIKKTKQLIPNSTCIFYACSIFLLNIRLNSENKKYNIVPPAITQIRIAEAFEIPSPILEETKTGAIASPTLEASKNKNVTVILSIFG